LPDDVDAMMHLGLHYFQLFFRHFPRLEENAVADGNLPGIVGE
jgi:hypothetical protein